MKTPPCRSLRRPGTRASQHSNHSKHSIQCKAHNPQPSRHRAHRPAFATRPWEHDAWRSTEGRPLLAEKRISSGPQHLLRNLNRLREFWRSSRCLSTRSAAEPLRRSSWNYPHLERSAAPSQWRFAIQNRIGCRDPHACATALVRLRSPGRAKPLHLSTVWTTQLEEAQLTSERVQSETVCWWKQHKSYPAVQHFM